MNIVDVVSQAGGSQWVRNVSGASQENKAATNVRSRGKDTVDISSDARKLSGSGAAAVKSRVQALPEVREEKIQEVKEKIDSGFYSTDSFRQVLAEKMIATGALS